MTTSGGIIEFDCSRNYYIVRPTLIHRLILLHSY